MPPTRRIHIQLEQEADGRWLASIAADEIGIGGIMAYGEGEEDAAKQVIALALSVLSDMVERGEAPEWISGGLFTTTA